MITRRSFLAAVRNRIAAGVLCSLMLTDFLERQVIEEEPTYIYTTYKMNFEISEEMLEDDSMYQTLKIDGTEWKWQAPE